MIIILPTKRISALSWWKTFMRVLATRWRRKQLTLKLRNCRSMYNKISTRRLPLVRYIICKELIITRRTAYSRSLLATRLSTESNRAWSTYVRTADRAGGVRTTWRVLGELSARRSTARWLDGRLMQPAWRRVIASSPAAAATAAAAASATILPVLPAHFRCRGPTDILFVSIAFLALLPARKYGKGWQ